jgi:isopentenyl diphosphate isomerase/L-lactate dehydrogenase-like FMN-dependent dehydrogenase
MTDESPIPKTIAEFAERARELIPEAVHAYFATGSGDELTLRANDSAWTRHALRQRVVVGVEDRSSKVTLLGTDCSFPLIVAPTAWQTLAHPEGELATAHAAGTLGIPMCLSTWSGLPLEDVASAAPNTSLWFQTQFLVDRSLTDELIDRAVESGYKAVVLTLDQPVASRRDRSMRLNFTRPQSPNLQGAKVALDPSVRWEDVVALVERLDIPVLAKGIIDPRDAELAVESGCAAVIVSNHGGRQLDGTLPTATALPQVADVVAGRVPVMVDGGIRRGTDVAKALALGADAAMIGRPIVWALAVGGEAGVRSMLELIAEEFEIALALMGVRSPSELGRDNIVDAPW